MKLIHIVGLMICLSILVVVPAFAYFYINPSYLTNATPNTTGFLVDGSTGVNVFYTSGYDPAPSSWLFAICSPKPSGNILVAPGQPWYPPDSGGVSYFSGFAAVSTSFAPAAAGCYAPNLYFNVINYSFSDVYSSQIIASWYNETPVPPACAFSASPTNGASPLLVSFQDLSTNNPNSWYWEISDNTTHLPVIFSTVQSWTNYVNGDNKQFDINFSATNPYGNCVSFKPNYITTTGSSNTTQYLIVSAKDYLTGALVSDTAISIKNTLTGEWNNITAENGIHGFIYNYLTPLYIEAVAPGYAKSTKSWTVNTYPTYDLWMLMYPGETPAAANVSLHVVVFDGTSMNPMPNAQVRLSDGQVKTTSAAGVSTFNVSATKSYSIIASYPGYNSATRTLTTGAGGTSQDTYLTLSRIVVTTSPTLPPGVTAVVTLDTRTDLEKDKAMMKQIRDFAPTLITLAMLMTALYIVGYKP